MIHHDTSVLDERTGIDTLVEYEWLSEPGARQREFDLGVAACALTYGATLWTLNADDFRDIPGLGLFEA